MRTRPKGVADDLNRVDQDDAGGHSAVTLGLVLELDARAELRPIHGQIAGRPWPLWVAQPTFGAPG